MEILGIILLVLYFVILIATPVLMIVAKGLRGLKVYGINFGIFLLEIGAFFLVMVTNQKPGFLGGLAGLDKAIWFIGIMVLHQIGLFVYSIILISRSGKQRRAEEEKEKRIMEKRDGGTPQVKIPAKEIPVTRETPFEDEF